MLTNAEAYRRLRDQMGSRYDRNEAEAIAHAAMEHLTGLGRLDRLMNADKVLDKQQDEKFEQVMQRLLKGEPLQYIIGEQWFLGRPFIVNEHVLIPRPETEELVKWIASDYANQKPLSIVDVGTGSGCIAVSLAKMLPAFHLTACDVSSRALDTARQNALRHQVDIRFIQLDFLDRFLWKSLGSFDLLVSNPPYIPEREKCSLDANVRDFEPSQALFVPSNDPLLFYRAIAVFSAEILSREGAIYCEVHPDHAEDALRLFKKKPFKSAVLRTDLHGKKRMLRAKK